MTEPNTDPKMVTIAQACEACGVSRRTIYNWLGDGTLRYRRTAGGNVRIFADSLWREPVAGEFQKRVVPDAHAETMLKRFDHEVAVHQGTIVGVHQVVPFEVGETAYACDYHELVVIEAVEKRLTNDRVGFSVYTVRRQSNGDTTSNYPGYLLYASEDAYREEIRNERGAG